MKVLQRRFVRLVSAAVAVIGFGVHGLTTDAHAALINLQTQDIAGSTGVICTVIDSPGPNATCTSGPTPTPSGFLEGGTGFAQSFADITTGLLRAKATGDAPNENAESALIPTATAKISETFTVVYANPADSGTGTLRALLDLQGAWDVFRLDGLQPGFQAQGTVSLRAGIGGPFLATPDNFTVNGTSGTPSGTADEVLSTGPIFVADGQVVEVEGELLAQISAGQGFVDFNTSAALFLETSPGISLVFDDPAFLSNPAFPLSRAAVPEPNTLALMALGLLGAGYARRRRSH